MCAFIYTSVIIVLRPKGLIIWNLAMHFADLCLLFFLISVNVRCPFHRWVTGQAPGFPFHTLLTLPTVILARNSRWRGDVRNPRNESVDLGGRGLIQSETLYLLSRHKTGLKCILHACGATSLARVFSG